MGTRRAIQATRATPSMAANVSSRSDTSAGRLTNAQLLARGGHGAPPAKPRWASPSPGQSATPTQTATDRHHQDHKSSPSRPQIVTTKTTNRHHQHHRLSQIVTTNTATTKPIFSGSKSQVHEI